MDVEGHEFKVLRGAEQIIRSSQNLLVFLEFHTSFLRQLGHDPREVLMYCRDIGLECVAVCGNGRVLRNPPHSDVVRELELITAKYGTHFFFERH
jgi:hypothetical protein